MKKSIINESFVEEILKKEFPDTYLQIYERSYLIQYLDKKTGAIHGNSKSRRSFASIYALYSILHFYVQDFYGDVERYKEFSGYPYTQLLAYCRKQYGGDKMQNHALNSRFNSEFINKIGRNLPSPIIANNGKYLIHVDYLVLNGLDISRIICEIIERYVELIRLKDSQLVQWMDRLSRAGSNVEKKMILSDLLNEDSEARVFEIISYAVLRHHYKGGKIYMGWDVDNIKEEELVLYKTGRTNANDGGIDFVMRPLGRFFQVTEVNQYDKYLLDADKVLHYPMTFVVKTNKKKEDVLSELNEYINEKSGGMEILKSRYSHAVEEIITINEIKYWLENMDSEQLSAIIDDVNFYYKIEMHLYE